jgi:hypothetical protein
MFAVLGGATALPYNNSTLAGCWSREDNKKTLLSHFSQETYKNFVLFKQLIFRKTDNKISIQSKQRTNKHSGGKT